MNTGTENYYKVEELKLGDINVTCNIYKPKFTNNIKKVIDYGWKNQVNNSKSKRRKIV